MLSVITLVRNRNRMLRNFVAGLEQQRDDRFELVVVEAGGDEDPLDVLTGAACDWRVVEMGGDDERIAYSRARNVGARTSDGEHVLFCDADTILGPSFVGAVHDALDDHDALCTGELRYLPPGHGDLSDESFDQLARAARPHAARPVPPLSGVRLGLDHPLVWGLNMGLRRSTFDLTGGFDEQYHGYAGEDTDLARHLAELGVPTGFVADALVLHQHHDSFEPPLQQFRATLANAGRYRSKWGEWPMGGWLAGFERLGLLERHDGVVSVLRDPTPLEVEAARCNAAKPFRSSSPS